MADPMNGAAKAKPDPLLAACGARVEAVLERDSADPATIAAELEAALGDLAAAQAPGRKTRAAAKARKALDAALEAFRAGATDAAKTMREALELHRRAHDLPPPKPPRRRFGLGASLEDLPPPKTVCRRLEWDVGRPPMIIGPPGAAKTYAVQQAVIDLVLGRALWGCPDFKPPKACRCLHVDLDQGRQKTLRRYQRLLRGAGVTALDEAEARRQLAAIGQVNPWDLGAFEVDEGEGLALMSLAPEELARWRAAWADAARGYDVVFIDSLRRLAPFLDENDSRFSLVPDVLRAVSEACEVVFILLHHASNRGGREKGPKAPAQGRGTSAIDGAAGTQLTIEKEKDARRVTQGRGGEDAELEAFYLVFENDQEAGPGGMRGVRLKYRTAEQVKAPDKEAKAGKLRVVRERALAWIRETNLRKGYGPLRKNVVANVEGKDTAIYSALDELIKEALVVEVQTDGEKVRRLWAADVLEARSR